MAHSINLPSVGGAAFLRTGHAPAASGSAAAPLWQSLVSGLATFVERLVEERRVRRSIAELEQLDDHLLKDIGIYSRGEICSVARYGRYGSSQHG